MSSITSTLPGHGLNVKKKKSRIKSLKLIMTQWNKVTFQKTDFFSYHPHIAKHEEKQRHFSISQWTLAD